MKRIGSLSLVAALVALSGCAATIMKDPTTGQIAECRLSGVAPIINQQQCISSYEGMGWKKVSADEVQKGQQQKSADIAAGEEQLKRCTDDLKRNPSLQIIATKIALGGADEESFSMLADQTKPSSAEKPAIALYGDLKKKCFQRWIGTVGKAGWPAPIISIYNTSSSSLDNLLLSLFNGSVTYGEFTKLRKELIDARTAAITKASAELDSKAADAQAKAQMIANQSAIAQSQIMQAYAATNNSIANQRAADAMMYNATKPTHPAVQAPANINCRSYVSGSAVNTNCY